MVEANVWYALRHVSLAVAGRNAKECAQGRECRNRRETWTPAGEGKRGVQVGPWRHSDWITIAEIGVRKA